jgi:hypothetical protein
VTHDTPISVTSEQLTELAHQEAEAEERAALEAMRAADEPQPAQLDAMLTEIEKLAAADLVMLLRHANTTAISRNEIERARLAQAGRKLAAELLDGCRKLERFRPSDDVPEWLREGSDTPLTDLTRRQA